MAKAIGLPITNLVLVLAVALGVVGCGKKEEPPAAKGAGAAAEVKSQKAEGLPAEVTRLSEETKRYAETLRAQPAGSDAAAEQLSKLGPLLDQLLRHMEERDQVRQQGGDVSKPEAALATDLSQLQEIQKTLPTPESGSGPAPAAGQDKPPLDLISENLTNISQIVQQGKELVAIVRQPKDQTGVPSGPSAGLVSEETPAPSGTQASDPSRTGATPSSTAASTGESPTGASGGTGMMSAQSSKATPSLATGAPGAVAIPGVKAARVEGAASCCSIVPNPDRKGRMGRLVVAYPDGTKISGARTYVYKAGDSMAIAGGYGKQTLDLLPGSYDVVISGKRVEQVTVKSGHDTQVKVGVLRVTAGSGTRVDVLDTVTKKALTGGYGKMDIGLPIGPALVQVAGQSEAVTIEAGKITDF